VTRRTQCRSRIVADLRTARWESRVARDAMDAALRCIDRVCGSLADRESPHHPRCWSRRRASHPAPLKTNSRSSAVIEPDTLPPESSQRTVILPIESGAQSGAAHRRTGRPSLAVAIPVGSTSDAAISKQLVSAMSASHRSMPHDSRGDHHHTIVRIVVLPILCRTHPSDHSG
jgi:hypothetical protein